MVVVRQILVTLSNTIKAELDTIKISCQHVPTIEQVKTGKAKIFREMEEITQSYKKGTYKSKAKFIP